MSDSEKRLESLKKKCKIASVVLMVFKVLFGITMGICIVAIIASIVKADDINKEFAKTNGKFMLSERIQVLNELLLNINVRRL